MMVELTGREMLEPVGRCWSPWDGSGARGMVLELTGRCWSPWGDAGAHGVKLELIR